MGLKEELQDEVRGYFKARWTERDARDVPTPEDLRLDNDAANIDAVVLYADMRGSTKLVDDYKAQFAAEVYKSFLTCAARIIKSHQGVITSYDGDRIMSVFMGDRKNTQACKTALKVNYAVREIIQPLLNEYYPKTTYQVGHVVGIDCSKLMAARIGVKNHNDIVWVGRAANYAAKMCAIRGDGDYATYISKDVFDRIADEAKFSKDNVQMWEQRIWPEMGYKTIYRSNWWWGL